MTSSPLANSTGQEHIFKICLTGGPCGGKTTSIEKINQYFTNMGWRVFVARETATIVLGGGVPIGELSEEQVLSLQTSIVKVMMTIEDSYYNLAVLDPAKKPTLIICDRGVMDASAYCSAETWKQILTSLGLNEQDVKETRYDCIVHMVTAADGAERWYTLDNTEIRTEGLDLARALDQRLLKAWMGHPNLFVITNNQVSNFDQKVNMGIRAICTKIGVQAPVDRYNKKKYLVSLIQKPEQVPGLDFKEFDCLHTYLSRSSSSPFYFPTNETGEPAGPEGGDDKKVVDIQIRVRKRGHGSLWQYTSTTRRIFCPDPQTGKKEYIETKRNVNQGQYIELLTFALPTHYSVEVKRYSFIHLNQYFELDLFQDPAHLKGLVFLTSYVHHHEVSLPTDWLKVEKEVTDDGHYSLFNLARKKPQDQSPKK